MQSKIHRAIRWALCVGSASVSTAVAQTAPPKTNPHPQLSGPGSPYVDHVTVLWIGTGAGGSAVVRTSAAVITNPPACFTWGPGSWQFTFLATDQTTMALLLTARVSGLPVRINGNPTCGAYSLVDIESVNILN